MLQVNVNSNNYNMISWIFHSFEANIADAISSFKWKKNTPTIKIIYVIII